MSYDERLHDLIELLTPEIARKDFDTLTFTMRVTSPRATNEHLAYTRNGERIEDDRLGEGLWGVRFTRALLALHQASREEGWGEWDAATLTVHSDGHFDLDFA